MIGLNRRVLLAAMFLLPAALAIAAGVKIKVDYDKTFDFAARTTYAWHPTGAGQVKVLMSGTAAQDPADLQARLEPVIVQGVEETLKKRGLSKAAPGEASLHVNYYLLVGAGQSMQQMGQFLPATTAWGLPPMMASTTSHEVYVQGSLIVDLAMPGVSTVWRGSAQTEVDGRYTEEQRRQRITDAITRMFEKFPPKMKKK